MIINGGSRRVGGWWAKHLENAEHNERVTLAEIVGLDAATIPDLMHEMEILARNSGSRAQNYFYQANVNPRDHEHLTPAQRHEAKELLLENLGLAGQPHFVVEHEKQGRVHFHVIAFRIDMERGRAISDSLTAQIHERTSRELEIRFDLQRGKSVLVPDRDFERPERGAKKYEIFRGAEGGISEISDAHHEFITKQKMFFVGTAAPEGRVNIAPKDMESLRVMGPNRIVWRNLTGAENETTRREYP
jgi:hypothetical protein